MIFFFHLVLFCCVLLFCFFTSLLCPFSHMYSLSLFSFAREHGQSVNLFVCLLPLPRSSFATVANL